MHFLGLTTFFPPFLIQLRLLNYSKDIRYSLSVSTVTFPSTLVTTILSLPNG